VGLDAILARAVPTEDRRVALPYATGLGVLLRSLLVEREPIYRQAETVRTFAPALYGLDARQRAHVGDDQIGRALDRLFDADRAALLTGAYPRVRARLPTLSHRNHVRRGIASATRPGPDATRGHLVQNPPRRFRTRQQFKTHSRPSSQRFSPMRLLPTVAAIRAPALSENRPPRRSAKNALHLFRWLDVRMPTDSPSIQLELISESNVLDFRLKMAPTWPAEKTAFEVRRLSGAAAVAAPEPGGSLLLRWPPWRAANEPSRGRRLWHRRPKPGRAERAGQAGDSRSS
jgi:hypothetical protein